MKTGPGWDHASPEFKAFLEYLHGDKLRVSLVYSDVNRLGLPEKSLAAVIRFWEPDADGKPGAGLDYTVVPLHKQEQA